MKESNYIEKFRIWKKEYDNLNTLHKEFMKRETIKLARKIIKKDLRTKPELLLANDLLDSLVLN